MGISTIVLFCSIVFIAAIVQGVSGFAFGMIVLMVLPHIFGHTSALAVTNLTALLMLLYNSYLYRKYANWSWIPLAVTVLATTDFVGILILKHVGDNPLWHTLMGALFIIMALYLLWGQSKLQIRPGRCSLIISMSLCGFITGMFAVGGPIAAAFFLVATKTKEEYLGTMQIVIASVTCIDVLMRALNGMYTLELVKFSLIGVVFTIAGILLARKIVRHIDALMLRRIVCIVMALDGLVTLLR